MFLYIMKIKGSFVKLVMFDKTLAEQKVQVSLNQNSKK